MLKSYIQKIIIISIVCSSLFFVGQRFQAKSNSETSFYACLQNQSHKYQKTIEQLTKITCQNITDLEGLAQLQSVEKLDISNSNLQELPQEIGNLSHLQELHLSNNTLLEIPTAIFSLKKLKALHVMNNNLAYISPKIGELKQLETLNISGNNLLTLPAEINELSSLKQLMVSTNRLLFLPKIDKLTKLETLYLENNQLVNMPNISNLPVVELKLNNNLLTEKEFSAATKTFSQFTTYQLTTKKANIQVIVDQQWSTMEHDLRNFLIYNDGSIPYGISTVELTNLKTIDGHKVEVETYFDMNTGKIKKVGNLTAQIMTTMGNDESQLQTINSISLELRQHEEITIAPSPITPPNSPNDGDESLQGNTDNGDGENTPSNASEVSGSVTIIPAIDSDVSEQTTSWLPFFLEKKDGEQATFSIYQLVYYIGLTLMLLSAIFIPLFVLYVLLVKLNRMYKINPLKVKRKGYERCGESK